MISEALRGEGAKLYDNNGKPFMDNIHKLGSLAPRDIVSRGIHQALIDTAHPCVYLDISHKKSDWIKKRFPTIYKHCMDLGINITNKPIPVVPAAHYSCGGIGVNLNGRTSLKRLYAIGEVSCTGVHGANRLASTSLLECLVWGYIAGKNASQNIEDKNTPETSKWIEETEQIDSTLIAQDWLTIKNTMWNYVGLVRTRERLHRAQHILRNLQYDIEKFYQKAKLTPDIIGLRNGIQTAVAVTSAALEDRESKGCHFIKINKGEKMPSFDIVSTFDIQELDNAVNITAREVTTRYDLRDQSCKILLNKTDKTILVEAKTEMALKAMTDILQNRSVNRKLSIKIFEFKAVESASGMSVRQTINLKEGITKENSKKINTLIKNLKLKVQPQIQGEQLRVTAKKIDDLQNVIEQLKNSNIDIHLDFVNFKKITNTIFFYCEFFVQS